MMLTDFHKDLLKRIKGGEKVFAPGGDANNQLEVFQTEAAALIELEQYGLITIKAIHHQSQTPRRFYDCVVVEKLTEDGRKGLSRK